MSVKELTLDDIVEYIDNMKVMDLALLVKKIEEKYGVSAAAPVAVAAVSAGPAAVVEEKTSFEVILSSFTEANKIKVIKVIRELTGLGLKEAKDLVEGAPKQVKSDVSKEEAEKMKKQLEEAGGAVQIK